MELHPKTSLLNRKRFIFILVLLILMIGCVFIIQKSVAETYQQGNDESSTAEELINHANTMYSFGRAKGNTAVEFEKAIELSQLAKNILNKKGSKYSLSEKKQLTRQADIIIATSTKAQENNNQTVNNYFPFFLDINGKYKFMEEDESINELDKVTTCRTLENLLELPDFSGCHEIAKMPYFCIIIHHSGDEKLQEAATQYLNLHSKLYTISEQELSGIINKNISDTRSLINDTTSLVKVGNFFKTKDIVIIEINNLDKYNGVYYDDSRINKFNINERRINASEYTTAFTDAREYNSIFLFKFPLFLFLLCFLILAGEIAKKILKSEDSKIFWHRYLITGTVAFTCSVIAIELTARYFAPDSGEFYATDKVDLWHWLIAFSVTVVPLILTHLISGKLDNYFSIFDSGLDNREGIFSIVFPALSCLALLLFYYSTLRFGFTYHLFFAVIALFTGFIFSILISYYWKMIKDIPETCNVVSKTITWSLAIMVLVSAILYAYNSIECWDIDNTISGLVFYLLPCLLTLPFAYLTHSGKLTIAKEKFIGYFPLEVKKEEEIDLYIPPLDSDKMLECLIKNKLLVVYGTMRMGKTTFINHCVINFNEEEKPQQIIQINFKSEFLEGKKIHYFPFAEGMAELLPYNKFNDAADEARKSGNIIGNLIGSISSAAKILVDENETKATDLEKISDIIIKKIYAKKTLIIFDNIDLAMDENKELFILLLNKILIEQGKIDNSKFSNNTLSLVFLSLEGFHVKKEFENLIDALMELNTKQELIWKANHNNDSDHISNHLPYFNLYPNHDFLDKYLTKSQVSLFDKKELSEKFRKTDKDRIPGVIADSIKKLKETKQLRDDEKTGVFEYISKFAEESLPETPQQLGYFVKVISGLSDEQRELLRVCAYSALNEGEFEVEAVCVLSGLNRLVVLNMFSKLEKLNIIYDEKKRNDWYRFNDLRFLIVLKDFEGDKLDDVSILAKEFYKKWSKFYYHQFSEVEKKVWLNKDLLMKLAERLFIVALDNPNFAKEAKEINEKVGLIFLKPENAFFDQSEKLFNAAIKIVERYPEKFEEKDIFYLQIKGLLMTYRCKNELTTDKATKIFNQKSKIIEQCNELKFDLQLSEILLFILNINPYRDDFQEELKAMNKQVDALILDATISLSKNVRLKFYKLLLVLKGGKPINEINELADKYKSLLIDIDALPSLKNECIEEGVYLEILNSYGQLIVDNVLGHNDQSFALSTKEAIFEDAIKILSIRLNYEVIKTNQEANESDDLTKNILEKLKILQLPENKHKFDRTGLCFTLNFITRAFYNINYSNKKLQIRDNHKEVIINCSTFALRLNKELDTNIGVIIAASLNGEIFEYYNDHSSSLESYEIAFAYSFPNNYNQFRRALDNMKRLKDNKDIDKKRILHYQEMSLKRHLLCHFDDNSKLNVCEKQELLERDIIKNELDKDGKKDFGMKDLEKLFKTPGSKFRNEVFSNPNKVIDFSKKLLRKHENEIVEDLFSKYLSIDLNIEVGIDNLIPLSFITDDNKNNVLKEKRNNYYCNVIKGIAPPKTSFITIILEKGNELEIKTIFPGKFAPPFPVESQTKEQFQTATKFWEENVFIG